MTYVNKDTKKGKSLLYSANRYDGYTLDDVYGKYSVEKARGYNYCLAECIRNNGYDFHICSHNCMMFSVSYKFTDTDGIEKTVYHTHVNAYIIY